MKPEHSIEWVHEAAVDDGDTNNAGLRNYIDSQQKICFDALSAFKDTLEKYPQHKQRYQEAVDSWPKLIGVSRELLDSVEDLESTFELMHAANQRAIAVWRQANPGNDLVLPDQAKLVTWLLDELNKKAGEPCPHLNTPPL